MNHLKLRFLASLRTSLVVAVSVLTLSACTKKQNTTGTQAPGATAPGAATVSGDQAPAAANNNAQAGEVAVGNPAPELGPAAGAELTWAKLKGKVVIVDFWAAWCAPCKEELPELEEMYKTHKERGLTVIGINQDEERDEMQAFLKTMPLSFPMVFDEGKSIAGRWQPPTMPTAYVIDRQGKIAFIQAGYERKDLPVLVQKVEALLAQGS